MSHNNFNSSHIGIDQQRLLSLITTGLALLLASLVILSACTQQGLSQDHRKTVTAMMKFQDLQAVHMVSATTGWLWTKTRVWHTSNGGTTWQDVTPPKAADTILAAPSGAYVLNGTQALVTTFTAHGSDVVAIISRTEDGGHTWQSSVFPAENLFPYPSMMSFINDQDGWVEARFQGATGNDLVAIFRTTDGGKTWLPLSKTPIGPALPNTPTTFPFFKHKSGLTFVNASTGWAAVYTDGVLQLYVTHNGGATWQGRTLSLPVNEVGFYMPPPTFFNAHRGILPVDFQTPTGSGKEFLVTHDDGASWQATTPVPTYEGVANVIDMAHVWVAAAQGTDLYSSSDGAQHWKKMTPTIPIHITRFAQLNFISPTTGWAVGLTGSDANPKAILLKTTTGGRTWIIASGQ